MNLTTRVLPVLLIALMISACVDKIPTDAELENKVQTAVAEAIPATPGNSSTLTDVTSQTEDLSQAGRYYATGVDFQARGWLGEAISAFDEAILLDTEFALAYGNRGAAYISLGQVQPTRAERNDLLQQAVEDLNKALHLDPNLANAYADRAVVQALLGMPGEASEDVERAAELGFDCNLLIQAIEGDTRTSSGSFRESAYYLCGAPDFEVNLYPGQDAAHLISLSDLLGKPLVLAFWFPSCPPCRAGASHLQEFHDERIDSVNVLWLDVGYLSPRDSQQDAIDILEEIGATYAAGYPLSETVTQDYGIFSYPSTVFITADGRVFEKFYGFMSKDMLVQITDEMISFSEPPS